ALSAAAVFELEGEVVAINLNSLTSGLHSAVISITEIIEAILTSTQSASQLSYSLIKVILGIVRIAITIVSNLSCNRIGLKASAIGLGCHLKQYQSIDHAAIVIKGIFLSFDSLNLVGIQLTVTICIVPVVIAIIVFLF